MPNAKENVGSPSVDHPALKDNTPNAARLVLTLRETAGYNFYKIVADIIDNSIDAEADHINILIQKKNGSPRIIIADNGYGMDEDTLQEAMRLGSNLEKDKVSDLGCFGVGMKVASFSVCKKSSILTLEKGGTWKKAILDIDKIVELDKWVIECPDLLPEDHEIINECSSVSKCGTIIVWEKLDRYAINTTTTANILRKNISRIFWKKIIEGVQIEINGELVESYDPLEWEDFVIKKVAKARIVPWEGEVEVGFEDGGEKKVAKIQYRCMSFPAPNEPDPNRERRNRIHEINHRNCGVYIYRNDREICHGMAFGSPKHMTHHGMRIGLYFRADELDIGLGTNFNKSNIDYEKIQQSIRDKLESEIVNPFAGQVRKDQEKQSQEKTAENVQEVHDEASRKIRERGKGLYLATAPESKEERQEGVKKGTNKPTGERPPRDLGERRQTGKLGIVEWKTADNGRESPIYQAEKVNRKLVITWNSGHPFYHVIHKNKDLMRLFDYTIHAMASAEMDYTYNPDVNEGIDDVDAIDVILNFKSVLSNNLRVLLG